MWIAEERSAEEKLSKDGISSSRQMYKNLRLELKEKNKPELSILP